MIILPGTGADGAIFVAEKIRIISEGSVVKTPSHGDLRITVSLGVSSYRNSITSFEELLKEADEMLYLSKKKGRNQVTAYSEN